MDKRLTSELERIDLETGETEIDNKDLPAAQDAEVAPRPPKDIWDKIGALAPIISGLMIFVMGGYFTYSFNQQQLRLQEIQTIEKFIPHLMGNDQSKRAAILAISSLTNAELAGKFAQIFASKGTVSALQSLAENGTESDKSSASTALAKALENIAARESKLNEMETSFQQALNEKTSTGKSEGGLDQVEEANRLEHLAEMCKGRGQLNVAESLLKQAVNIRIRVQLPSDAKEVVATLKKLADTQLAAGNREESDSSLKKISLIEAKFGLAAQGQGAQAHDAAAAALPGHENAGQVSRPVVAKPADESAKEEGHETPSEPEVKVEAQATGEYEPGQPKPAAPEEAK
jgi:hypothetical protein